MKNYIIILLLSLFLIGCVNPNPLTNEQVQSVSEVCLKNNMSIKIENNASRSNVYCEKINN
jgi:PBP1b-binding outer membrane lipoprotein LpoB